jgi:hypothetical protein
MDLQVGQELQVISKGGVITLVPERPLSSLRGGLARQGGCRD